MRDLVLLPIVLYAAFLAVQTPWKGILGWVWVSVMNPHRLTFGFMLNFPVAALVGGCVLVGLFVSKDRKSLPMVAPVGLLIMLMVWFTITLTFSVFPVESYAMWDKVFKILLMTIVATAVLEKREHVHALIWMLVLCLAFYGTKGGFFTLIHGGQYMVRGPAGSFIEPNNELALALVMVIPLINYCRIQSDNRWVRHGLIAAMLLTGLSVLGSHSRGALLAVSAMIGSLWWASRHKLAMGTVLILIAPLMVFFMPEAWWDRMGTIDNYQQDASAMGRINAWWMAWNLAADRFLGGGFEVYNEYFFGLYAPSPTDIHAAHSIYFQILGEHGFVGLFLYLAFWVSVWQTMIWVRRNASTPDMKWAQDLAAMVQVSLIGYAVGGAFLSLAYFDLPYYLMVAMVVVRYKIMANQPITAYTQFAQGSVPAVVNSLKGTGEG